MNACGLAVALGAGDSVGDFAGDGEAGPAADGEGDGAGEGVGDGVAFDETVGKAMNTALIVQNGFAPAASERYSVMVTCRCGVETSTRSWFPSFINGCLPPSRLGEIAQ
jgi:hypothetical protein